MASAIVIASLVWQWQTIPKEVDDSAGSDSVQTNVPVETAPHLEYRDTGYDINTLITLTPEEIIFDMLKLSRADKLTLGQAYVKHRLHPDNVYADNEYNKDRTINRQHSEEYLQIAPFLIQLFRVGEPQLALEIYDVADNKSFIWTLSKELCDYLREEWTPEDVLELLNSVDIAWQRGGRIAEEYLRIPPPGFEWKESMNWASKLPVEYVGYVLGKAYERSGDTSNGLELLELLSSYPDDVNLDYGLLPLSRIYKADEKLVREIVDSMVDETPIIFGEWYRTQHLLSSGMYKTAFEWTLESRLQKTRKSESERVYIAWIKNNVEEAILFLEQTQILSESEKRNLRRTYPQK